MDNLPYLDPDREFVLNVGVVLLILDGLAVTEKGKRTLTLDKVQSLFYLVGRPAFLNRVLSEAGKDELYLKENEYFTISNESGNVDTLFNRDRIKLIFRFLAANNLLTISYHKDEGFLFELNQAGKVKAESLGENYFSSIKTYVKQLSLLQSVNLIKLNKYISNALRQVV